MTMMRSILCGAGLAVALASAAPAWADEAFSLQPVAQRAQATEFTLNDLSGETVRLSDYKGKVVLVNFWATWCGPCVQELPFLSTYHEELGGKGFAVLALSTDGPETLAEVRRTVQRRKWKMPILLDSEGTALNNLNPRGQMPFSLYLDREGRIAADQVGYTAGDEVKIKATIEALLAEGAAPAEAAPAAPASAPAEAAPTAPVSAPAPAPAEEAAPASAEATPATP